MDEKKYSIDIDDIDFFNNDKHSGVIISWSGNIGWGEYAIYRDKDDQELKLYGDSECMDYQDDKSFLQNLMKLLMDKIEIVQ